MAQKIVVKHTIKSMSAALALAIGVATSAAAGSYDDRIAMAGSASYAGALLKIAWTQNTIWVGRTNGRDQWRCHYKVGNTVYASADRTETRARAKLRPYTDRYVYCFPLERIFPF